MTILFPTVWCREAGRGREREVGEFGPFHDTWSQGIRYHTILNSMVQRARKVDLGSFMTPGLSKDFQCH